MSYSRTYGNYRRHPSYERNQTDPSTQPGSRNEEGQQNQESDISRQERRVGYTVFAPDERKRSHLQEVAKREMDEALARQEARRPQTVYERPQRVGGTVDQFTAVLQKQRDVAKANSGLEMKKKREQWQREKMEKERKEIEGKKAKARAQAERNAVLRAVRESEQTERHREEHRRKNNAFLDKLEFGY